MPSSSVTDGTPECCHAMRLTRDRLVQLMVGRRRAMPGRASARGRDGVRRTRSCCRSSVCAPAAIRTPKCRSTVHRGEVLGIAGLIGAGRTELAEAICGVGARLSGRVLLDGQPLPIGSPRDAIRHGICLVPEDRRRSRRHGGDERPRERDVARAGLVRPRRAGRRAAEDEAVRRITAALAVKAASIETPVATLSGGNQQKVVLGKWLALRPRVIVFDEPTQGVDVGAKAEIHRLIRGLADQGTAVVMISSDMEEIVAESDRVAVMHDGLRHRHPGPRRRARPKPIMQLAVA